MKKLIVVGLLLISFSLFAEQPVDITEQEISQIKVIAIQNQATIAEVKSENEDAIEEVKDQHEAVITEIEKKLEGVRQQVSFINADKYIGDKISYSFDIPADKITMVNGETKPDDACIPARLEMRVFSEPDQDQDGNVLVVIPSGPYSTGCNSKSIDHQKSHPLANKLIKIPAEIAGAVPRWKGWTYGTLFVPYKSLLRGSKDLKGSSTIGPYTGYRKIFDNGWETKLIAFAGPSIIENSTLVDGEVVTDN